MAKSDEDSSPVSFGLFPKEDIACEYSRPSPHLALHKFYTKGRTTTEHIGRITHIYFTREIKINCVVRTMDGDLQYINQRH